MIYGLIRELLTFVPKSGMDTQAFSCFAGPRRETDL